MQEWVAMDYTEGAREEERNEVWLLILRDGTERTVIGYDEKAFLQGN